MGRYKFKSQKKERKQLMINLLSSKNVNELHLFLKSVDQLFDLFFFQVKLLQAVITDSNQFVL